MDDNLNPDQWTTDELETTVNRRFLAKQREDEALATADKYKEEGRELEQKIRAYFEYYGKDEFVSSLGRIELRRKLSFKTPKTPEDKKLFFEKLQKEGIFWEYVGVNSNALNAYCKEEYETARSEGREPSIPGIEPPTEYSSLHIKRKDK